MWILLLYVVASVALAKFIYGTDVGRRMMWPSFRGLVLLRTLLAWQSSGWQVPQLEAVVAGLGYLILILILVFGVYIFADLIAALIVVDGEETLLHLLDGYAILAFFGWLANILIRVLRGESAFDLIIHEVSFTGEGLIDLIVLVVPALWNALILVVPALWNALILVGEGLVNLIAQEVSEVSYVSRMWSARIFGEWHSWLLRIFRAAEASGLTAEIASRRQEPM